MDAQSAARSRQQCATTHEAAHAEQRGDAAMFVADQERAPARSRPIMCAPGVRGAGRGACRASRRARRACSTALDGDGVAAPSRRHRRGRPTSAAPPRRVPARECYQWQRGAGARVRAARRARARCRTRRRPPSSGAAAEAGRASDAVARRQNRRGAALRLRRRRRDEGAAHVPVEYATSDAPRPAASPAGGTSSRRSAAARLDERARRRRAAIVRAARRRRGRDGGARGATSRAMGNGATPPARRRLRVAAAERRPTRAAPACRRAGGDVRVRRRAPRSPASALWSRPFAAERETRAGPPDPNARVASRARAARLLRAPPTPRSGCSCDAQRPSARPGPGSPEPRRCGGAHLVQRQQPRPAAPGRRHVPARASRQRAATVRVVGIAPRAGAWGGAGALPGDEAEAAPSAANARGPGSARSASRSSAPGRGGARVPATARRRAGPRALT